MNILTKIYQSDLFLYFAFALTIIIGVLFFITQKQYYGFGLFVIFIFALSKMPSQD